MQALINRIINHVSGETASVAVPDLSARAVNQRWQNPRSPASFASPNSPTHRPVQFEQPEDLLLGEGTDTRRNIWHFSPVTFAGVNIYELSNCAVRYAGNGIRSVLFKYLRRRLDDSARFRVAGLMGCGEEGFNHWLVLIANDRKWQEGRFVSRTRLFGQYFVRVWEEI